ncbi:MAG TPA: RimK family protein [Casimicrobiaceae bacterium]|nr:RimK family protein [Casimicrobiaceae bacterium]
MIAFFVVNQARDWPLSIPGVEVVSARTYLTDPSYRDKAAACVVNLCRFGRYQGLGYYVSLLAEARGHDPIPRVKDIRDVQSDNLVRLLTEEIDELIQLSLATLAGTTYELIVYFGRDIGLCYDQLSQQLFNMIQVPLLKVRFERRNGLWRVQTLTSLEFRDIPVGHHEFIATAARDYVDACARRRRMRSGRPCTIAILHNADDPEPPSNAAALAKFSQAAAKLGMRAEFITRKDWGRLDEFDGLFLRETTSVNHYTYRFSRRAAAEGLVVIDDPDSILRCSNKVYLSELLSRHAIPTPRTMIVHRDNVKDIVPALGLPCVLKQPDSAFSLGVVKVEAEEELQRKVGEFLEKSDLIVAQEWVVTEFDWRIGVLDRRPLYACRYMMAPGHWQVIKRADSKDKETEGATIALPVEEVPPHVLETAVKAANFIGNGLYGVDLKEVDGRCCVIEVNDNPNVDHGNEDAVLGDAVYERIMDVFRARIEARRATRQQER